MFLPVGVISNCCTVLFGGVLGSVLTGHMPDRLKTALPRMFGLSAMTLGIRLISRGENLSPIILSLIIGDIIGEILGLDNWLRRMTGEISSRL